MRVRVIKSSKQWSSQQTGEYYLTVIIHVTSEKNTYGPTLKNVPSRYTRIFVLSIWISVREGRFELLRSSKIPSFNDSQNRNLSNEIRTVGIRPACMLSGDNTVISVKWTVVLWKRKRIFANIAILLKQREKPIGLGASLLTNLSRSCCFNRFVVRCHASR